MKRILQNLLLSFFSIILFILFIEAGLKVINYPLPAGPQYEEDNILGWKLKSNFDGISFNPDRHTKIRFKTNSKGLRDREYGDKGINVFRILALGDSFTEAAEVDIEDSYTKVLEAVLNKKNSDKVYEVINAGVSGYGNDQELQFLKENVQIIKPDLVIVGFCIDNDIGDNLDPYSKKIKVVDGFVVDFRAEKFLTREEKEMIIPYYAKDTPSLKLRILFKFKSFLRKYSNFYRLLGTGYHHLLVKFGFRSEFQWTEEKKLHIISTNPKAQKYLKEILRKPFVYSKKYSSRGEEGWRITKRILKEISDTTTANGGKTVIVIIPTDISVHQDRWSKYVRSLQLDEKDFDLWKPHDILTKFGKEHNIPIIDLLPRFIEVGKREQLYFESNIHWNLNGHRFAGEEIYRFLLQEKLIK